MSAPATRGLYVYAMADRQVRVRVNGIFRRPVHSIEVPGLAGLHAVVEAAARSPRQSIRRLREQDRVLRALALSDRASIIPARFGAFFPDRQELAAALRGAAADLRRSLRLVRGCMQMTTRVFFEQDRKGPREPEREGPAYRGAEVRTRPPQAEASGAAHLMGLVDAERARRSHPVLEGVQSKVAPFVKAERVEWHDTGGVTAVSLFHLVPRTRLEPYVDALARACRDDSARLLVTGPFLPFAFAQGTW